MTAIERYQENVMEIIGKVFSEQAEILEKTARLMSECVSSGHMVYAFGTGHAHILSEELFYRAGGLAAVTPILDEKLMLHISASGSTELERRSGYATELLEKYGIRPGDMMLIFSNSGRNTAPVEMALEAKKRGAVTVALTNKRHSLGCQPRKPYGKRLLEVADIVIDNGGIPGDASMDVGLAYRVGATSTVIGAALLEAIESRCVEIAVEKKAPVDVFSSSNVDGGDQINEAILEKYRPLVDIL